MTKVREISNDRSFCLAGAASPHFERRGETHCFASGREALKSLADALDLRDKSTVLLPAYVPEGVIWPFVISGYDVVLYPIDRNLDPLWPELEALFSTKKPTLAVLIHYFGLAKDARRFRELCDRFGVLMIEDLAHVLPAPTCEAGRDGDYVLYSPPKLLGLPDGGILVRQKGRANPPLAMAKESRRHIVYVTQQLLSLSVATLARRFKAGRWLGLVRRVFGPYLLSYPTLMSYAEAPHSMSATSRFLLQHCDWDGWAHRRLAHAAAYDRGLDHTVFKRVRGRFFEDGGPFGFPVMVDDRQDLEDHLAANRIRGLILEGRWNFIPEEERANHPGAVWVLNNHFLFPTDQHLADWQVQRVIAVANAWAERRKGSFQMTPAAAVA